MLKTVVARPQWIDAESVLDIFSVSGCDSTNFADYIKYWKHNGYWFFDSPQVIRTLAKSENFDITGMTWFYYDVHEEQYDECTARWSKFSAEASFPTNIVPPLEQTLEGYDVATFAASTSPEHSPLSCNSLAKDLRVNEHCLFDTFDQARSALENGQFADSEPGPFRIFAVYRIVT
ncbi:hypothetical protein BH10CYA1_BH10CYA1_40480 [soil metagenome]